MCKRDETSTQDQHSIFWDLSQPSAAGGHSFSPPLSTPSVSGEMNLCITARKSVHVSDRLHLPSCRNSRTLIHGLLSPPFHTKRGEESMLKEGSVIMYKFAPSEEKYFIKAAFWRCFFILFKLLLPLRFCTSPAPLRFGSLYLVLRSMATSPNHPFNWEGDYLHLI